jgi:chromosomal replication initiation ATPase DnaA
MTQYALDITLPVAYVPEQFIISESNQLAHGWMTRWPEWPGNAFYLHGEHGAGKTHLAHIWQHLSQAVFLNPDTTEMPQSASIIDGVERWKNEEALFHLYNHCKSEQLPLLLLSTKLPQDLPFTLPDLRSRLNSLPVASISAPDDALLEAVLCKQLADRQLKISPEVVSYLLPRLPRSFAGLAGIIAKLDSDSLASGRTITIPYIRQVCGW